MGGIEGFGADDPDFFDNLDDLPPSTPSSPTRPGVFGRAGEKQIQFLSILYIICLPLEVPDVYLPAVDLRSGPWS